VTAALGWPPDQSWWRGERKRFTRPTERTGSSIASTTRVGVWLWSRGSVNTSWAVFPEPVARPTTGPPCRGKAPPGSPAAGSCHLWSGGTGGSHSTIRVSAPVAGRGRAGPV